MKRTFLLSVSLILFPISYFLFPLTIFAATLSLSPTSNSVTVGSTFNVTIQLNTSGQPTYGVDVYSLHFNPAILQVVDSDGAASGVQIAPGTLMSVNQYNTVNNTTGVIQFSQTPSTGASNFTGSGTLATITFRGIAAGTSAVTFDYTAGSTIDCNVASLYSDLLSGVTNGSYTATVVVVPPTISGITISGLSPTNVTISWNTSTPTNGQVKYGATTAYGSQSSIVDNTTKTTSHVVTLTSLSPLTLHHYQVVSVDASSNSVSSADATFTTLGASDTTAPPVPSGLTATAISSSQINLSWTAVVDPIVSGQVTSGMSLYKVFRAGVQVGTSGVNNFSNTGLTSGTAYSYTVSAQDVTGNTSSQSGSASATTFGTTPTPNPTPSPTPTPTPTPTPSPSPSPSPTPSPTPSGGGGGGGGGVITPSPSPTPVSPGAIPPSPAPTPVPGSMPVPTPTPVPTTGNGVQLSVVLYKGVTSPDVFVLQAFLVAEGYLPAGTISGFYGPLTEASVQQFQRDNNIVTSGSPETTGYGVVGVKTRTLINSLLGGGGSLATATSTKVTPTPVPTSTPITYSFTRNLSLGLTGADVKLLQQYLNTHGFVIAVSGVGSRGFETTYFGPATTRALAKFQQANNISPAVGFFGPITRSKVR